MRLREVEMSIQDAATRFLEEAQAYLAREGVTELSLRHLGKRMAELGREPDLISEADLAPMHDSDASNTILASLGADSLTLMPAKFPAPAPTPIHDHNSWGVACVVQGRDHYIQWERVDDGADPSHARLRVLFERDLTASDGPLVWLEPPDDIHSQQGVDGPAWELVLFGCNPMVRQRQYFDVEAGTVRHAMPS